MICFDDALFDLYEGDKISYEEALKNADSENDLRLKIKLHSKRSLDTKHIGNLNTKWQLV
jgi:twitching motility protein PilU